VALPARRTNDFRGRRRATGGGKPLRASFRFALLRLADFLGRSLLRLPAEIRLLLPFRRAMLNSLPNPRKN
jgi:hypothetical protein